MLFDRLHRAGYHNEGVRLAAILEKVTAFITRPGSQGLELLLFRHPHAGIQIPAGTVNTGESPDEAVLREAREETGLEGIAIHTYLGSEVAPVPPGQALLAERATVYSRPDPGSFDWAFLRRGSWVSVLRHENGFTQVRYDEEDRLPDPQYTSLTIMGWVADGSLASTARRHFFLLEGPAQTPVEWRVSTDNHTFTLFWAPLLALPPIIPPQDRWLAYLEKHSGQFRSG